MFKQLWGRSSAGSPKHSETHPTKNLINKLLSMPFYGGVAQLGAQSTQKRTLQKFNKNQLLSVLKYGGVAHLGERLNGIQEVRGSIPLISTIGH